MSDVGPATLNAVGATLNLAGYLVYLNFPSLPYIYAPMILGAGAMILVALIWMVAVIIRERKERKYVDNLTRRARDLRAADGDLLPGRQR